MAIPGRLVFQAAILFTVVYLWHLLVKPFWSGNVALAFCVTLAAAVSIAARNMVFPAR